MHKKINFLFLALSLLFFTGFFTHFNCAISLAADLEIEEVYPISRIEAGLKRELTTETLLERSLADHPMALFDDAVPAGAMEILPLSFSGRKYFSGVSSVELSGSGREAAYFIQPDSGYSIADNENIIFYLLVDKGAKPEEILVAFYDETGSSEHRIFWGADRMNFDGETGTFSNFSAGPVPLLSGIWHRVSVPAKTVGMGGHKLCGVLMAKSGGTVYFDRFTKSAVMTDPQRNILEPVENILTVYKDSFVNLLLKAPQAAESFSGEVAVRHSNGKTYVKNLGPAVEGVFAFDLTDDSGVVIPSGSCEIILKYKTLTGSESAVSTKFQILQLISRLILPWEDSIVNATVPVYGDALGLDFSHYTVTFEEMSAGGQKETKADVAEPRFLVDHRLKFPGKATVTGNLCSIDVGTNLNYKYQKKPAEKQMRYNGKCRIELKVYDKAGNCRTDRRDVIVGRIISSTIPQFVESNDSARAAIFVEPYSITEGFTLCSLLAVENELSSSSPVLLNGKMKLASGIYEARPRGLEFDVPAVLRLYGIDSGDGTSSISIFRYRKNEGWKALSTVFEGGDCLSSKIYGFNGSGRTYFAAWRGDIASAVRENDREQKVVPARPPIEVRSSTHPFFMQCDFENGNFELSPRSMAGNVEISIDTSECFSGRKSLRITNKKNPSDVSVRLSGKKFDAMKYPVLSFNYKCPATFEVNLMILSQGRYFEVPLSHSTKGSSIGHTPVSSAPLVRDGRWHNFRFNILEMIKNNAPEMNDSGECFIDEIFFCDYRYAGWAEVVDGFNEPGAFFNIDDLQITSGGSSSKTVNFSWNPLDANVVKFKYCFDQFQSSTPRGDETSELSVDFNVASDQGVDDWYFHLIGFSADAKPATAPMHFQARVDNTPPAVTETSPADGAFSSTAVITARIFDSGSGVNPAFLSMTVDGVKYMVGDGALTYDSSSGLLKLEFFRLRPARPGFVDGQSVSVVIDGVADNAGNKIQNPYAFNFTVDYSAVTAGRDFLLTGDGGESPAWSPDSKKLAYVSYKTGRARIYEIYVEDKKTAAVSPDEAADYLYPSYLSDGSICASKRPAGCPVFNLVVIGAGGTSETPLTFYKEHDALMGSASFDGKYVVFSRNNEIYKIPSRGGQAVRIIGDVNGFFLEPSFSPDGKTIIYRKDLYTNTIWTASSEGSDPKVLISDGYEFEPSYSVDGKKVVFTEKNETLSAIYTANADGSEMAPLIRGGIYDMKNAKMSPDGKMIAYESTRNGLWNISVFRIIYSPPVESSVVSLGSSEGGTAEQKKEAIRIGYDVLEDGTQVSLKIFDHSGSLVKTLSSSRSETAGRRYVTWDGTSDGGKVLDRAVPYVVKYELRSKDSGKPAVKVSKISFNEKASALPVNFSKIRQGVFSDENKRLASESAAIVSAREIVARGRDNDPPSAVSDFSAVAGISKIDLFWKANGESDLAGYEIIRTDRGGKSRKRTSAGPGKTSFADVQVECGETYDYSITAVDSSGNVSNERTVTAVPEFDYYFMGIEHGGADIAIRLNLNTLEFDALSDSGLSFTSAIIAPPNLSGGSRFIFSFNSNFYNIFCYDKSSGDIYYTRSQDLKSFAAWRLLFCGFEVPEGVSNKNSVQLIGEREDKKFIALCYDPEFEILWAADITRGSPRLAWKKVSKNLAGVPGGSSAAVSAGIKDGKYIFYYADPSIKSIYKTVTPDFKSWSAWKKAVSFK